AVQSAVVTGRQLQCPTLVLDPGVVPVLGEIEAEDLGDPSVSWAKERVDALLARRKVARNGAVDRVCRELFGLAKAFPDMNLCLTQSRSLCAVADSRAMQDVFEDLANLRLFYWHDAALCARRAELGLEAQGEWLETFAKNMRGMS